MSGQEEIIGALANLEGITAQYDDVIKAESDLARQECALVSAEHLQAEFVRLAADNRLLNIGIIGRVKAGKSSLLNSVFFNGESILPKAATPMTASLTVMTYGDTFSATVEYYSASDIDEIKRLHDEYEGILQPKIEAHKKVIEERAKKKGESLNPADTAAKAKRLAEGEIKNERLSSSFGHYELMAASGKLAEMRTHGTEEIIEAKNLNELMGQLNNYVGSGGALMPFTRNAVIRLPMDSLRDIQVVDTPGINDPVASRTERTNEYLSKCDVVFIVSPSGQFTSSEDVNLMDRLSSKEGVRELYFVGSQVDNQLYGNPGEESGWNLHKALDAIRSDLSGHAAQTLASLKQSSPEVGDLFDQLVRDGKERVIVTSALCHAMLLRFNERASWDSGMNHVWGLLSEHYPDYFGSEGSAKTNLEKLSGVDIVSAKIAGARKGKDAIIAAKQADYLEGQAKNIASFREKLKSAIVNKIDVLNNTDLKTVQAQVKNLKQMSSKVSNAIDGTFEDCVDDFKVDLRNTIIQKSKVLFEESKGSVNDAEKTESRSYTYSTGWWIFKTHHVGHEEVTTIRAGAVKNTLNNLINDLRDNLINSVEAAKIAWKKSVQQKITRALMEAVGDDVDIIDFEMLKTALRRMVGNLELPDFDISSHAFTNSQTGNLEGSEAESFISEAQAYQGQLRTYYSKQTNDFVNALEKSAKREQMSGMILGDISAQLETLEKELGNKKLTLQRLDKCLKALQELG
jgi:GTPase Era involved in 16S rRNA processing